MNKSLKQNIHREHSHGFGNDVKVFHMFDAFRMEPMSQASAFGYIPKFLDIPAIQVRCAMCDEFICDDESESQHIYGIFMPFLGKWQLAWHDAPVLKHHRSTYYMCEKML